MPATRGVFGADRVSVANPALRSVTSTAEIAEEIEAPVHGDSNAAIRSSASSPGAQPSPAPQSAPPQVTQVSAAIRGSTEGSFDIHLNPTELGKVRISLIPSDAGILVSVLADRPETLDLLRRHVDLLAQDFREMGYESASFSFGAGGREGSGAEHEQDMHRRAEADPGDAREPVEAPNVPGGRMPGTGRMDLRV
ncbi:MAG: flagellar hook-length control protein FliK [Roseovarius sp.]